MEEIERLSAAEDDVGLLELGTRLFRDGDEETAFECYRAACKLGNVTAMGNLGYCYQFGRGTKINYRLAAYCYEKAGEQDDPQSLMTLGDFYYRGKGDVPKDPARAYGYFLHACQIASFRSDPDPRLLAQTHYRVAVCQKNGTGTPINYEDAYEHYQIAAEALADDAADGDGNAIALLNKVTADMEECETHF